jgi:hypothetical protein
MTGGAAQIVGHRVAAATACTECEIALRFLVQDYGMAPAGPLIIHIVDSQ